jgi:hypothetical protein
MEARWIGFGEIEIEGRRYDHDVVIDAGRVGKRKKKASKERRGSYGHTPLTAAENIPWGGRRLIVGTGAYGSLPVAPDVLEEGERRGVEVLTLTTPEALDLLHDLAASEVYAVIHVTC